MGRPEETFDLIADADRVSAVLDPLRRRLLEELRARPDSAAGLADRLGESRQRLNYHLRALERTGFVELEEERRKGNCVERVLRVTARRWLVDPAALGELASDPETTRDRFSAAWLAGLGARLVGDVARLREKADRRGKRLATAGIESEVRLGEPSDFDAFARDLTEAIAAVVARHHDESTSDGRTFRVIAGVHPETPTDEEAKR
ncbi:MAG: helix-turn-helix domain-containing protein [Gemmatimonadota bacterium]|nr:helix-turn-helix domain-containing protein [Gemmatimonadota bacterium]